MTQSLTQAFRRSNRLCLLDGPMGTRLTELGFPVDHRPGWSARALVEAPELVEQIHREYVLSGSQLITANTFRTHVLNLQSWGQGDRAKHLTSLAVSLARRSLLRNSSDRAEGWVLGSMAPVGDCYSSGPSLSFDQISEQHELMSEHLFQAGVDGVILETHVSLAELMIAARAADARNLPMLVSVYTPDGEHLLDGTPLKSVKQAISEYQPLALGVNCVPVERVGQSLQQLSEGDFLPGLVYANSGEQTESGNWRETSGADPQTHARLASDWLESGVKVLGGCCGTGPELIKRFSKLLAAGM